MIYKNKNFLPYVEEARKKASEETDPRKRLSTLFLDLGKVSMTPVEEMSDEQIKKWLSFFYLNSEADAADSPSPTILRRRTYA